MNFEEFKKDTKSSNYKLENFIKKWEDHPKFSEYNQKIYDEDFEDWVKESYNYNESLINDWKIFKNTCDMYTRCLNSKEKILNC